MVSVIIPCYNCEDTLARSIESVLQQTYTDWELLLVDNNSRDNTLQVMQHYQTAHPQKIKVYRELKKGAPAARNKGLQMAKGTWIQYLDADDELASNKLEHQLLLAKDAYDLVIGATLVKNAAPDRESTVINQVDTHLWRGLITSNLGITSANLWRTAMLRKVGGWNEALTSSQEYDLMFLMLQQGARVLPDQAVLTTVYKAANSVSQSEDTQKLVSIVKNRVNLRYRIKAYLQQQGLLDDELRRACDTFLYTILMHHVVEIPGYAKKELKKNKFDMPLDLVLKLKWAAAKKKYRLLK